MTGQKPREIAVRVLGERRHSADYTEKLLDRALARTKLSPADRGLAQELVAGIVRWQSTLDWLIAGKTQERQQKPGLQDLLRLGLYQIFWLDRIPDHAAVHETVALARQRGYGRQAGFINAVLRSYLRAAATTRDRLAELKIRNPAVGLSHPQWLVTRWEKQFGADATRRLLELHNTPPRSYARINSLNFGRVRATAGRPADIATIADFLALWREENVQYRFFTRDWTGENLVFELQAHPPLPTLGSFQQGWFYIQDPSTLLAVRELEPQPGETVLDLCAAPGGKTTYVAQLMNNTGRIVAADAVPARLKLVAENCRRLGITCCVASSPEEALAGPSPVYDRILVDAPCSNTGVLRRRVDLRWRVRAAEISRLSHQQKTLLRQAATHLKSGGLLVYSTCSLEPEENTQVVRHFLTTHPEFKLERERQLLPFADGTDGAYVARLRKGGSAPGDARAGRLPVTASH